MTRTVSALLAFGLLAAALPGWASEWTRAHPPFRVHGNTYYVGSHGLSALLIASDAGHVLIDVPMEENLPRIEQSIRALGFRLEDVRLILNSHAHHDHAGGIAGMALKTGAQVRASIASANSLRLGGDDPQDPQHGSAPLFAAVSSVEVFEDGANLRVGDIELTAHLTPGHTPGSTSWSWRSCEAENCLTLVYADSLSAMATPRYRYSDIRYPERIENFRRGLAALATLECDVLITPHPEASGFLQRVARREAGESAALQDPDACRRYAEAAGVRLDEQIAKEAKAAAR